MVNFGFGLAGFIGIALVAAGVGLYALRSMRPNLARDHDIFFAAVAALCGGILMFQGWRLDPILLFGQFLMTGSAVFFAVESIRLRGIVTQQAKRNTPIVDDDRPVSSVYQTDYDTYNAELEELEPAEDYPPTRRIPGTREVRRSSSYARETYGDESRPRPTPRRTGSRGRPASGSGSRKPRPRPSEPQRRSNSQYDSWDEPESQVDRYSKYEQRSNPSSYDNGRTSKAPKSKRTRPSQQPYSRGKDDWAVDATPVDYVDYNSSASSSSNKDIEVEGASTDYTNYGSPSPSRRTPDAEGDVTSTKTGNAPKSRPSRPKSSQDFNVKAASDDYTDYSPPRYPDEERSGNLDDDWG